MEEIPSWYVMIKIEKLDEVYVRVFSDGSIEQELADFFTYEYPGARFTPRCVGILHTIVNVSL